MTSQGSAYMRFRRALDRGNVTEALSAAGELQFVGLAEAKAMARPEVAVYLAGWGRLGDTALVAEGTSGRPLGAAWYRLFSEEEHSFGFFSAEVPELTIAVERDERGRGIGTALLEALTQQATTDGYGALSLSVEEDNPALRLYERAGFVRIRQVENASTMRLGLGQPS